MKKIMVLFTFLLLVTGCKEKGYDYTCKKTDNSNNYKLTKTVEFSFDAGKVYKLKDTTKEEYQDDESVNNAYDNYQSLYDNYNENNVKAEYKKADKSIIAAYYLDKSDIDDLKIKVDYQFSLTKDAFISKLTKDGYKCKEN